MHPILNYLLLKSMRCVVETMQYVPELKCNTVVSQSCPPTYVKIPFFIMHFQCQGSNMATVLEKSRLTTVSQNKPENGK